MATKKAAGRTTKRSLFAELMTGVEAIGAHSEGRLTLKTRDVQPIALPPVDADIVRDTREALKMSRHVFAFKLGVNPRTLERWEQGRSKPNEQAAALIWLVRKYPDTLERMEPPAAPAPGTQRSDLSGVRPAGSCRARTAGTGRPKPHARWPVGATKERPATQPA